MPQRKQVSWAQLRVGILVIVGLAIFAAGVFLISGQVGFFSSKYTVRTFFASAEGLRPGAQVQLAGVPVGNVASIQIAPSGDPRHAVEIGMRIPRSFRQQIRADSEATLETVGLLGDRLVEISRGSAGQPPIPDRGVVPSREEPDIKQVVQNTNEVISNLRVVSAKLSDISNQISSGRGSLGRMIYDETLYHRLNSIATSVQQVVNRAQNGEGTVGKMLNDETLYQRTLATIDRMNQVMDQVQRGNGTIAKFINDPALYDNLNQTVNRANTLLDNVNQGKGSLGRLATDPELYNRMNNTFDRLNTITTRIEQGQGSLGLLSTDTRLYNNLTESSQSLRDFLTEFRKSPKKYLTLRLRIF